MTTDVCDTEIDRGEVAPCSECDGHPETTTAHGLCSECGAGTCRTCDGEGIELIRTGIDSEREVPCQDCGDDSFDERDDGDARYDARRDDLLTDRECSRDSAQ